MERSKGGTVADIMLLKPREAARRLSISERSLWALGASGELPRVKIGRSVRYHIDDIEAMIERQKITS